MQPSQDLISLHSYLDSLQMASSPPRKILRIRELALSWKKKKNPRGTPLEISMDTEEATYITCLTSRPRSVLQYSTTSAWRCQKNLKPEMTFFFLMVMNSIYTILFYYYFSSLLPGLLRIFIICLDLKIIGRCYLKCWTPKICQLSGNAPCWYKK